VAHNQITNRRMDDDGKPEYMIEEADDLHDDTHTETNAENETDQQMQ